MTDFRVGASVMHISLGRGVVTAIERGEVCVLYETSEYGRAVRGRYDNDWFRIWPGVLNNIEDALPIASNVERNDSPITVGTNELDTTGVK